MLLQFLTLLLTATAVVFDISDITQFPNHSKSSSITKLLSKLMPNNLSQYRVVVGTFNSQFIHIKQHDIFKNAISQSKMKQTIANEILAVFNTINILINFK